MKAAVRDRYGPPEVVELREIDEPVAADDEVLVRVRAASVNPADWYAVTGRPYVARALGGTSQAEERQHWASTSRGRWKRSAGTSRTLRPGDEVFGGRSGAFAEYVCVREARSCRSRPT